MFDTIYRCRRYANFHFHVACRQARCITIGTQNVSNLAHPLPVTALGRGHGLDLKANMRLGAATQKRLNTVTLSSPRS